MSNCCTAASRQFGIHNPESIARRKLPHDGKQRPRDSKKRRPLVDSVVISEDFLRAVDAAIPEQPWKAGVHREVAEKLQCHQAKVYAAIEELIVTQRRNVQRDGIVFGLNGEILAIDNEREVIPPESVENRKPK